MKITAIVQTEQRIEIKEFDATFTKNGKFMANGIIGWVKSLEGRISNLVTVITPCGTRVYSL